MSGGNKKACATCNGANIPGARFCNWCGFLVDYFGCKSMSEINKPVKEFGPGYHVIILWDN